MVVVVGEVALVVSKDGCGLVAKQVSSYEVGSKPQDKEWWEALVDLGLTK
jgi:hypothetical protein